MGISCQEVWKDVSDYIDNELETFRRAALDQHFAGCTTGTIGLPNPNQRRVVKTSGFLHPYRYTARVPRDRILAFEGEGMTWMRQPSRQ